VKTKLNIIIHNTRKIKPHVKKDKSFKIRPKKDKQCNMLVANKISALEYCCGQYCKTNLDYYLFKRAYLSELQTDPNINPNKRSGHWVNSGIVGLHISKGTAKGCINISLLGLRVLDLRVGCVVWGFG
jgi:hypothetical protein